MNETMKNGGKGEGEEQALQKLLQKNIFTSFMFTLSLFYKTVNTLQNKR